MKAVRLLTMAAIGAACLLSPVAPAVAAPSGSNNQGANAELLDFCYGLIASGIFPSLTLGECMSYNLSSDAGFKAHFCDFLRETGAFGDYGYTSYSDCVRNPPWE